MRSASSVRFSVDDCVKGGDFGIQEPEPEGGDAAGRLYWGDFIGDFAACSNQPFVHATR